MMKNVVYLHTHDTGRCIAPYGYAFDTPNLAAFARANTLFRQAFDCGPTCSPARAALLTGQYPHQCGMLGLAHRGFELSDPKRHLANFLKNQGYRTVLCGIQHETVDSPEVLGYQECFKSRAAYSPVDPGRAAMRRDADNTDSACAFLERHHEEPFFLSLGLFSTHRPFPLMPDAADDPDYLLPPAGPDTPECRRDWAAFATMARHADRCFGRVFDLLKSRRLLDQTLVIVTTDHGPAFPGMKCTLSDHGCGVMLLLRVPGAGSGLAVDAQVSHLDLFPTVCAWTGLSAPDYLEGKSLLPLLRGDKNELHEATFAEINFHAARDVQRSVRTARFRYVRRFDDYPGAVLPNIDDGLTKRFLRQKAGLEGRVRIPQEQLFDRFYDPGEAHSVAADPAYTAVLIELRARLERWMTESGDPLTAGPLVAPPGARVNRQAGIDPVDDDWEPPAVR
jgi:arylsulfatase A-like enzyme